MCLRRCGRAREKEREAESHAGWTNRRRRSVTETGRRQRGFCPVATLPTHLSRSLFSRKRILPHREWSVELLRERDLRSRALWPFSSIHTPGIASTNLLFSKRNKRNTKHNLFVGKTYLKLRTRRGWIFLVISAVFSTRDQKITLISLNQIESPPIHVSFTGFSSLLLESSLSTQNFQLSVSFFHSFYSRNVRILWLDLSNCVFVSVNAIQSTFPNLPGGRIVMVPISGSHRPMYSLFLLASMFESQMYWVIMRNWWANYSFTHFFIYFSYISLAHCHIRKRTR